MSFMLCPKLNVVSIIYILCANRKDCQVGYYQYNLKLRPGIGVENGCWSLI